MTHGKHAFPKGFPEVIPSGYQEASTVSEPAIAPVIQAFQLWETPVSGRSKRYFEELWRVGIEAAQTSGDSIALESSSTLKHSEDTRQAGEQAVENSRKRCIELIAQLTLRQSTVLHILEHAGSSASNDDPSPATAYYATLARIMNLHQITDLDVRQQVAKVVRSHTAKHRPSPRIISDKNPPSNHHRMLH